MSASAMAEVCDKVAGDGWMPGDGPISLFWNIRTWGVIWTLAMIVPWLRWLHPIIPFALGIAFVLLGIALTFGSDGGDYVTRAAVIEGCRAVWFDSLHLAVGLVIVLTAWWRKRAVSTTIA
ncbi:MAG: hypothetical protein HOO99_17275 [Hyphomicrobiaceae bacterium]|nr:hypothetical protein [Hyphomicrobiaceae bacterium]